MTNKEAIEMFKGIVVAEIERIPSHYDAEVDDDVYDNTDRIDEILKLNKIVCEALEKQVPKKPIDNIEREWFECPTCGRVIVTYHAGERHHCKCGQAIDWSNEYD